MGISNVDEIIVGTYLCSYNKGKVINVIDKMDRSKYVIDDINCGTDNVKNELDSLKNILDSVKYGMNKDKEVFNLILIATKILSCDKDSKKIDVDIDRLFDEFRYFQYYQERTDVYLLSFFLPLLLVTRSVETSKDIIVDLADKLCTFYRIPDKKMEYILDAFCYDRVIRNKLAKKTVGYDIFEEIKDDLISLNANFESKKENLKFHMVKIKYIEELHRYMDDENYRGNNIFFEILNSVVGGYDFEEYFDASVSYNVDSGVYSVYNSITENEEVEDEFLKLMADYLLKIRYFNLPTRKYKRQERVQNFSVMNIGDVFVDPILNRGRIKNIEMINDYKYVTLETKTGEYKFKYSLVKGE